MKNTKLNIALAVALILMAAASRIVNAEMHLWNLAPVAALGLFSGAVLKDKKLAFLFSLLAMFISDAYFQFFTPTKGFYGISQLFNYIAMAGVTALGLLMKDTKAIRVLGFTVAGSVLFFLVSNFGVYLGGWHGYSFDGLVKTFVLAIPFFKNTLIGDLIGSGLLFGAYFLLQRALSGKVQQAKA